MSGGAPARVVIALGSNQGDRFGALRRAVSALEALPGVSVAAVSRIFRSAPEGEGADGGEYLNAAARLLVRGIEPAPLLDAMQAIERAEGRTDRRRNAARPLDLDLLLYDDRIIEGPGFVVPHPRLHLRPFVVLPAAEVAADALHPKLNRRLGDLCADVGRVGILGVVPFEDFEHAVGRQASQ